MSLKYKKCYIKHTQKCSTHNYEHNIWFIKCLNIKICKQNKQLGVRQTKRLGTTKNTFKHEKGNFWKENKTCKSYIWWGIKIQNT